MSVRTGTVRADGTSSATPLGVTDMASLDLEVSPEVEAKVASITESLGARRSEARFRIEVFLQGGPRKGAVVVKGVVAFFTNGGFLHGGGDAAVYLCPQVVDGHDCMAPIDMQFVTSRPVLGAGARVEQVVVCTECRRVSRTEELTGQIVYSASTQRWADILAGLFRRLGHSADISVSIERESLRRATTEELARYRGGDAYARVVAKRECVVYPLANILKDTQSGAALTDRFRAFLES